MEINEQFAETFLFKNIYPSFETFYADVVQYNINITSEVAKGYYSIFIRHYANSNVAYDTVNAFSRHFFLTFENVYQKYKTITETVEKMYNLTDDELLTIGTSFNNTAVNDNSIPVTPLLVEIPYVTQQITGKTNSNKIYAYINAINSMRTRYIDSIINEFSHHFITILAPFTSIYRKENN